MKRLPYLRPAMVARRKACLEWIISRRRARYWLAKLDQTPQFIAQNLAGMATAAAIGLAYGLAFGLAF